MSPSWKFVFFYLLQKSTGRLECASCRCGLLGGHRTLFDRASGSGLLLVLGLFLPAGSLLKRTLDVEPGFPGRLGEKPWWNVSWSAHLFP